jgi:tRNA pseudouridine38-40 synthase
MPRFRLTLEYAGTRYSGWQIQKNARTVQGEIERAAREISAGRAFDLYGSGRTDAGVHALHQVAHLDIDTTLAPGALLLELNDRLPADINILSVERVSHRFHARHGAVARSYLYQISRRRTAFAKPFVWWVRDPLDIAAMRAAAVHFVGFKDFRFFTDDEPGVKSTRVLLERLDIGEDGDFILLRVLGSHFLWKMVRRVVGVLVEVGRGRLSPLDVEGLLRQESGLPASLTAPPSGLFLERVLYEGERWEAPLQAVMRVSSGTPTALDERAAPAVPRGAGAPRRRSRGRSPRLG